MNFSSDFNSSQSSSPVLWEPRSMIPITGEARQHFRGVFVFPSKVREIQ